MAQKVRDVEEATQKSISLRDQHRRIGAAIMQVHGLSVTRGFSRAMQIALEEWAARNPTLPGVAQEVAA